MRLASRSIAWSKSTGKSTFTRCTSRPGRVACARSRCELRSSPESCISSRRAAASALVCEVSRFFVCARAADRDDAGFFIAVSNKRGPNFVANSPDHLMPRFVEASSGNLQPIDIRPDLLRFDEVDSVLRLAGRVRFSRCATSPKRSASMARHMARRSSVVARASEDVALTSYISFSAQSGSPTTSSASVSAYAPGNEQTRRERGERESAVRTLIDDVADGRVFWMRFYRDDVEGRPIQGTWPGWRLREDGRSGGNSGSEDRRNVLRMVPFPD